MGSQRTKGLDPRTCVTCGGRFQPYRPSQVTCSIACYRRLPRVIERVRQHHAQPDVVERKNAKRRVSADPARREVNLRSSFKSKYGVTYEDYLDMVAAQENRCAVCRRLPDPDGTEAARRLHVDRDLLSGEVRQLLCERCKRGVSLFGENPAWLRAAAEYIERHRGE